MNEEFFNGVVHLAFHDGTATVVFQNGNEKFFDNCRGYKVVLGRNGEIEPTSEHLPAAEYSEEIACHCSAIGAIEWWTTPFEIAKAQRRKNPDSERNRVLAKLCYR